MKLKKRSQNPGAPYYAWFRVDGVPHHYCTKTSNLQLAKLRAECHVLELENDDDRAERKELWRLLRKYLKPRPTKK